MVCTSDYRIRTAWSNRGKTDERERVENYEASCLSEPTVRLLNRGKKTTLQWNSVES